MRKSCAIILLFMIVLSFSVTSVAGAVYTHSYHAHKESVSVTVSGGTYDITIRTLVCSSSGLVLDEDEAHLSSMSSGTVSIYSYDPQAAFGFYSYRIANNNNGNEHFESSGIDT